MLYFTLVRKHVLNKPLRVIVRENQAGVKDEGRPFYLKFSPLNACPK